MSINKILTRFARAWPPRQPHARSAVIVTGVLASNLVMLGAAQAQHYDQRGPAGHGGYHAPAPVLRHAPPPHQGYGHVEQHRHHGNGDTIAKGIAIGVGALILGTVLANEANRHRDYDGR